MHKINKLKNGINLITVPLSGTKTTTVMTLFPIGSRYESKKISGASHFVEHLMFKGTDKRPTALDICRQLEAQGADYNAFTYKDYTGYYVKINAKKQELAYDLLADMVFHSKLDKTEIEKEKGVIVEELRMYEDNPTMAVDQLFDRTMFGKHPLGWDVGGTIQSVKSMTRKMLYDYYKSYYLPQNMVLVVAGKLPEKKKIKKYLQYFSDQAGSKVSSKKLVQNFKPYHLPQFKKLIDRVTIKNKQLDQAHLILGFPGLKYNDKRRYAAAVLSNILGMGMSSRLFVEIREKRGLAYMVRSGMTFHRDIGTFQIQAGLDPVRLEQALQVMITEIKKISHEKVTSRELKEAKTAIIGRMTLGAEDSSVIADWFAKQFWFDNEIHNYEQIFKNTKAVTAQDVLVVAKSLFKLNQLRLAAIGSIKKTKVLKILQKYI